MPIVIAIISGAITLLIGLGVGYQIRKLVGKIKLASVDEKISKLLESARRDAEDIRKEARLEMKDELYRARQEMERKIRERQAELQKVEKRLAHKEENLDRKIDILERKEGEIERREREVAEREEKIVKAYEEYQRELERLSGLTRDQAKQMLLDSLKREISQEAALMIKQMEEEAKETADKRAREIISLAIQRCAAGHTAETTVSVVPLPNDEMKGRIIGREGRNIRALEMATGIDIIIDDTPEAVILSGFDPMRREIARMTLEKLIADGRIHPARIEETIHRMRKEMDNIIYEEGKQAAFEIGVHGLHSELIRMLGRLKYRTSYGQNVLQHSKEVAYLAGIMASEMGVEPTLIKRAALLHDIGKAVDHEVEGTHVEIGVDICKRFGESPKVLHAIMAHHGAVEPTTFEAAIVQASDAISASRPGARRETLEAYIKRLTKLEEIASSFVGVEKSYAIQAGREIRIMVEPDGVDDATAKLLSRDIAKRIEEELEYPGQIKVTVIRELRAVEYAK
ncbi:MAG: ribonuclease Y [bacterium]